MMSTTLSTFAVLDVDAHRRQRAAGAMATAHVRSRRRSAIEVPARRSKHVAAAYSELVRLVGVAPLFDVRAADLGILLFIVSFPPQALLHTSTKRVTHPSSAPSLREAE